MFKRLHLLVIRPYMLTLLMTFLIAMFVLMMQFLKRFAEDLIGKGLDLSTVGEVLMYGAAGLVPMALPLAVLLASIMTFGTMGENNELLALKASGISLRRIMFPNFFLVVIISLLAFLFANNVMPKSNYNLYNLVYNINNKNPELNIREGAFNNDIPDFTIKIGKRNRKTHMLYNFMIYDHTKGKGNASVSTADSALMRFTADEKYLLLDLYSGQGYSELKDSTKKKSTQHQRNTFAHQTIIYEMQGYKLIRANHESKDFRMLNMKGLDSAKFSLISKFDYKKDSLAQRVLAFKLDKTSPNATSEVNQQYQKLSNEERAKLFVTDAANKDTLNKYIESVNKKVMDAKSNIRRYDVEWHRKITLSLACLIFFLIGAPLGAIIRKGGLAVSILSSVLLFITYYMISISGEKMVREGALISYQGMWLSSSILLVLGIFLTYKATNDSTILNIDTYTDFFKKLVKKK